jgi:hypothetical protein
MERFKDCRLARMSSGHYCLIRDLGLVKGGKGVRHHKVVLELTWRGLFLLLKSVGRAEVDRRCIFLDGDGTHHGSKVRSDHARDYAADLGTQTISAGVSHVASRPCWYALMISN